MNKIVKKSSKPIINNFLSCFSFAALKPASINVALIRRWIRFIEKYFSALG